MKIGYLAAILNRYKNFIFFPEVIRVYTYGVKIIFKFRWESGFLSGVPLYALTEGRGTLSVKC